MNPVPTIAILNRSTYISDEALAKITLAIGRQLAADVAPEYGATPALEFVPKDASKTPDSVPCYVLDEPDVEGALGYHDTDSNGNAYIKIFCQPIYDNGGTDYLGNNSVSVTISHEILELIGDTDANFWADGPDGADYAFELCDAVESDCYDVTLEDEGDVKVSVSNFVLKEFFNPKAKPGSARFDFMRKLKEPFKMDAGGYQIRRTEPGRVGQIFGRVRGTVVINEGTVMVFGDHFPSWKRPYKMRKAYKRSARLGRIKLDPLAAVIADAPKHDSAAKPPPYDFTRDKPEPAKQVLPAKTFTGPATTSHKPPFSPPVPKKEAQLPAWLEKIAVRAPAPPAPTTKEINEEE